MTVTVAIRHHKAMQLLRDLADMDLIDLLPSAQNQQLGQPSVSESIDLLWQVKADKLFETKADFDLWIYSPNAAINKQIPAEILLESAGYQIVMKLLGRMEHGIMA